MRTLILLMACSCTLQEAADDPRMACAAYSDAESCDADPVCYSLLAVRLDEGCTRPQTFVHCLMQVPACDAEEIYVVSNDGTCWWIAEDCHIDGLLDDRSACSWEDFTGLPTCDP